MFHCRDVSLSDILSMAIQLVSPKTLRYISHCVTLHWLFCILNVSFCHCSASLVYIKNAFSVQFFVQNFMENIFHVKWNGLHSQQSCQLKTLVYLYCGQEHFKAGAHPITISHLSLTAVNTKWLWASKYHSTQVSKIFNHCNINGMHT